jgi:cyclin-dependent kinase-like
VGSGTFGSVYKCRDVQTGEMVAIKKFYSPYSSMDEVFEQWELQVLQTFNHPNIIHAKKIEIENEKLYIVFEHLEMNLT